MNRKFLTIATLMMAAYSPLACAQDKPTPAPTTTTQQPAETTPPANTTPTQESDTSQVEQRLENQMSSTANVTIAPVTETSEDPLIQQYKLKKDKNFKSVEFELAKELALHRSSTYLDEEETRLFSAALQNLTNVFGSVSEPQKEETYFEYQDNPDTGEFVVVLVKDSYVKAQRGDVCQIGTQVFLRTSVQAEFTAKLATLTPTPAPTEMSAQAEGAAPTTEIASTVLPKAPTNVTEIECYNDERPTYSQRLVN